MNQGSTYNLVFCEMCKGKGVYFENNGAQGILRFCSCRAGERRRRDWEAYDERVKVEAERRRRRTKKKMEDFKAMAAGDREPGDDDVPF